MPPTGRLIRWKTMEVSSPSYVPGQLA